MRETAPSISSTTLTAPARASSQTQWPDKKTQPRTAIEKIRKRGFIYGILNTPCFAPFHVDTSMYNTHPHTHACVDRPPGVAGMYGRMLIIDVVIYIFVAIFIWGIG